MHLDIGFAKVARKAIVIVVAFLLAHLGVCDSWAYELKLVRKPEVVEIEALREQLERMGVGYSEEKLISVVDQRRKGFVTSTHVHYRRKGDRVEGPIRVLNGITLKFDTGIFLLENETFLSYIAADRSKGILKIEESSRYRSTLTLMEERLLMGPGTLMSRFNELKSKSSGPAESNPFDEKFVPTESGVDILHGDKLMFNVRYDMESKSLIIATKFSTHGEQQVYREIDADEALRFEELVPQGTPVSDYRLDRAFPAQYQWQGSVPSVSEINRLNVDKGSRSSVPFALIGSIGVAISGIAILFYSIARRRRHILDD